MANITIPELFSTNGETSSLKPAGVKESPALTHILGMEELFPIIFSFNHQGVAPDLVSRAWVLRHKNALSEATKEMGVTNIKSDYQRLRTQLTQAQLHLLDATYPRVTLEKFQRLQEIVQDNHDEALVGIWLCSCPDGVDQNERPYTDYNADEIRAYLEANPDTFRDCERLEAFDGIVYVDDQEILYDIKVIPDEIRYFPNLKWLDLSNLNITYLPESLKHLTKLERVLLDRNQIRGASPALERWHFPNLKVKFNLCRNPVLNENHFQPSLRSCIRFNDHTESDIPPLVMPPAMEVITLNETNEPNETYMRIAAIAALSLFAMYNFGPSYLFSIQRALPSLL